VRCILASLQRCHWIRADTEPVKAAEDPTTVLRRRTGGQAFRFSKGVSALAEYRSLRLARPQAFGSVLISPGHPEVPVIRRQGRLERARPAKPLKPRRDLGVIQVRVIAAVGTDELIHAGIAASDTAVHDADRLVPQERRAAVAGLTGEGGVMTSSSSMRSHGSR
jgi:hypothetical protein